MKRDPGLAPELIFSEAFLGTPVAAIAAEIQRCGIYTCEGAVRPEAVDRILAEFGGLEFRINENTLLPVAFKGQSYQNHFMALSRTAFRLVCHERITGVCRGLLGDEFAMVGKRIYETRPDSYMMFHSDIGSHTDNPDRVDGLGFILYLSDVDDGAFEIVEESQRQAESYTGSRANDAELIASRSIKAFPMSKGSYVIYNGRLIHRGQPMQGRGSARQSLHFQVNRGAKTGEPIYVNIGWLGDLGDDAKRLLGFGVPNSVPDTYPPTSPATIVPSNRQAVDYIRQNLAHLLDD